MSFKNHTSQVLSLRKERQRNLAAWFDPVKQGAALRRVEEEVILSMLNMSISCSASLTHSGYVFSRSFCFDQVKRRLVDVAIVARGDVFPNFAAFQEVLLKVQLHFQYFFFSSFIVLGWWSYRTHA
jgi:hypothetical protein